MHTVVYTRVDRIEHTWYLSLVCSNATKVTRLVGCMHPPTISICIDYRIIVLLLTEAVVLHTSSEAVVAPLDDPVRHWLTGSVVGDIGGDHRLFHAMGRTVGDLRLHFERSTTFVALVIICGKTA